MAEDYADSFKTEFPISVLMIDGTEDPLVKYEGGFVGFGDEGERGKSIAVERAFKIWSESNDCQNSIKIEEIDDNDGKDGCTAKKYTYYKCKDNTQVVLIEIKGGGHTWPGGSQYLPKIIVGKVCRDFDATEVIWEFFKKQETR
jgi:polyhydroxybutyrate depolymerase